MREDEKELEWLGNTLKFWQSVPSHARGEGGYQLQRVQLGFDPKNWNYLYGTICQQNLRVTCL